MNIRAKTKKALNKLQVPSGYQEITNPPETYITFFEYDYEYDYSEDEITRAIYIVQVDLWTKNPKYKDLEKEIIKVMESEDFYLDDEEDLYEKDTKIYHKAFRFKLENIKEVE